MRKDRFGLESMSRFFGHIGAFHVSEERKISRLFRHFAASVVSEERHIEF